MARIARIIWKGSHRGHYQERREAWLTLKSQVVPTRGADYAITFWSRVWELKPKEKLVGYEYTAGFMGSPKKKMRLLKTIIAMQPKSSFRYLTREELEKEQSR
jgi:hypothetical protein